MSVLCAATKDQYLSLAGLSRAGDLGDVMVELPRVGHPLNWQ